VTAIRNAAPANTTKCGFEIMAEVRGVRSVQPNV